MSEKRPVGFFSCDCKVSEVHFTWEVLYRVYINILCFCPNTLKIAIFTLYFILQAFCSCFGSNMLFPGTIIYDFLLVLLSLVSLFPLNCFQYTDTRILKFCHVDLLNIAVFFSFLLFSGSELYLLSSRMVRSCPINPKSPQ